MTECCLWQNASPFMQEFVVRRQLADRRSVSKLTNNGLRLYKLA